MDDILPEGNIGCLVELLAGLVEEGRAPTREQIRAHLESLCRAQMAKVETEHERITAEGFCPYGDQCKTHYYSCIRCQDEYFWQALRVAAGMEGGE